jgi:ABC-2 type transport system ATP-binding protein
MEEADKVADVVSIIDHGKIIESGSPAELKAKTNTQTLEEAFLELTGHEVREEEANSKDVMRQARAMWSGSNKR